MISLCILIYGNQDLFLLRWRVFLSVLVIKLDRELNDYYKRKLTYQISEIHCSHYFNVYHRVTLPNYLWPNVEKKKEKHLKQNGKSLTFIQRAQKKLITSFLEVKFKFKLP